MTLNPVLIPNNAFKTTENTEVNIVKRKTYLNSLSLLYVFKFWRGSLAKSFSLKCTQRITIKKGVIY
jgi:hypothetical protein